MILKGGIVYDGSSRPPQALDIKIEGDKIVEVGKLEGNAAETIDVAGCIVTPGFIDCHNHTDVGWRMVERTGLMETVSAELRGSRNMISQGVTTIITGNCGMGFTDITAWFNSIKSVGGLGTNVYHLIPYEAVKSEIIGTDQRPATAHELRDVSKKLVDEMRRGAVGFSTGLELAPAVYDSTDELVEAAKIVKKHGGIYATHIRSESGAKLDDGRIRIIEAIKEAIGIGRRSGIPVQISHIKINLIATDPKQIIGLIEAAQLQGIDVSADQYPYDSGMQRIVARIDTKYRTGEKVRDEFRYGDGMRELRKGIEAALTIVQPGAIQIASCDMKREYEGRTVEQIALAEGRSAIDVFAELACLDTPPLCLFFTQNMDIVRQFMKQDWVFTGSDASLIPESLSNLGKFHPRFYGNFPRKIRQFVLEEGLIDLQFAIRSMTSLPAKKFGLKNRGVLTVGSYADLAIIDLNKLTDSATYENPAQFSSGIVGLIVNGIIEIRDGKLTGNVGGRPCTGVNRIESHGF